MSNPKDFRVCQAVSSTMHRAVAAASLLVGLPLMGLCFVLVRLRPVDKGPFFYCGERLGYQKRPFTIYKIRTLVENAEALIGADIARPGVELEIPFGRFLRDTRLDELPQLFNVVRGDMALVGPRPVRRVMYEKYSKSIQNYDLRFTVKPGLTGYSQLLTPHRAPKRLRVLIDNHFVRRPCNALRDVGFAGLTGAAVLRRMVSNIRRRAVEGLGAYRSRRTLQDLRGVPRVKGNEIRAFVSPFSFTTRAENECTVHDLNYYALALDCDDAFKQDECLMLVLRSNRGRGGRAKQAKCHGFVYRILDHHASGAHTAYRYIVFYTPASDLNRYFVDQYMLHEAVL